MQKQKFDISEAVGGVHKHSQGPTYPIIHFQYGIGGCHDAYLLGSYFVNASDLSNPKRLADEFREATVLGRTNIYNWFVANGYPYNREGIRAAREYHEAQ